MSNRFSFSERRFHDFQIYSTRRERPKLAPYLRLKNIQGTAIGKISKKFIPFRIFFKSRTMPKSSKGGHLGSLIVFTNRKLQKMQGRKIYYPLIEFKYYRKKVA